MRKILAIILLFSIFLPDALYSIVKGVVINEFLTSNKTGIKDEDGEYSDWIELYNTNSKEVSLAGWALTDDETRADKWLFPDIKIPGNSYLLVFASEKDRRRPVGQLHTNFKLSADGEYLALFSPDMLPETELNPFPAMASDVSYGLHENNWLVFNKPTPGSENDINGLAQMPVPYISHNHGLYNSPFQIALSSSLPSTSIYYTLDASTPSKTNGTLYTNPFQISGTTVLRAVAVEASGSGTISNSKVITRTYIFPEDVTKQPNNPAGYPSQWGKYSSLLGYAIADYEMDPVLMAEAGTKANVLKSFYELPVVSVVTDKGNLFSNVANEQTGGIYIFTGPPVGNIPGVGWERPASFEYFFDKEGVSLQENVGLQLHGGHSRLAEKSPKHSFRIDFQAEYGEPKLNYPLFGKTESRQINSFFLRAGFGNTWIHQTEIERVKGVYSRDTWAKKTQRKMGNAYTNTQYAHLFLNGMYWGLYNPTERVDDDFCSSYFGGKKEDYDIIKVDDNGHNIVATDGNTDAWFQLLNLVKDTTDRTAFHRIQGNNPDGTPNSSYPCLIDIDNFIDYMLINFYGGNTDWDHHNWIAFRNRVNPGKGFRFLCWDSEHVLKDVNANILRENNPECPSYIFQQLKTNPLFRIKVGDRVQKHCFENGSLTPEIAKETWLNLAEKIETSLYAESARWGDYRKDVHKYTSAGLLYRKDIHYEAQKNELVNNYFPKRTATFISHLKAESLFPKIDAPLMKVNGQPILNDTVAKGSILSMSASKGITYYTTNGIDPVNWQTNGIGSVSPLAKKYSGSITLNADTRILARALSGSEWSALSERMLIVKDLTDIHKLEIQSDIIVKAFPNPFTSDVNISYSINNPSDVEISIFDISGRKVETIENAFKHTGDYILNFNASHLPQGIYIGRITIKGEINAQKIFRLNKI